MTSESSSKPSESSTAQNASSLPLVGDLSVLGEAATDTPLNLSDTAPSSQLLARQIAKSPSNKIPAPIVPSPNSAPGIPFAPTQAIPAEAVPAGLAAKAAATDAAAETAPSSAPKPEASTAATEPNPTSAPSGIIPEPNANSSANAAIEGQHAPQVRFKNENGKLLLILPSETKETNEAGPLSYAWTEVMNQLRQRLQAEARNWADHTAVHLIARDRLLNVQQLQEIVEALAANKLQLRRVYTSRRQTAITCATAGYSVEQHVAVTNLNPAPTEAGEAMAEPLVLRTTLRSGGEIRHNGTVVVIGDLNPGSMIVAEGDVVVWGRLRGNVHAGCKGDARARIMALQMEPAQIRIADFVARGPSSPPTQFFPEVAYVTPQGKISIARVSEVKPPAATAAVAPSRKLPATGKRFSS
jgi:septum site-determining protein MinC